MSSAQDLAKSQFEIPKFGCMKYDSLGKLALAVITRAWTIRQLRKAKSTPHMIGE